MWSRNPEHQIWREILLVCVLMSKFHEEKVVHDLPEVILESSWRVNAKSMVKISAD